MMLLCWETGMLRGKQAYVVWAGCQGRKIAQDALAALSEVTAWSGWVERASALWQDIL